MSIPIYLVPSDLGEIYLVHDKDKCPII
jgi:hypothetical protein